MTVIWNEYVGVNDKKAGRMVRMHGAEVKKVQEFNDLDSVGRA